MFHNGFVKKFKSLNTFLVFKWFCVVLNKVEFTKKKKNKVEFFLLLFVGFKMGLCNF